MSVLQAPFPWFGGKSAVAPRVWDGLGDVAHFVEPFFGSGAVLLGAKTIPQFETVNDADGLLCNFWRAVRADPEAVADHADWPVNEADLHARHIWLVRQRTPLTERLMADSTYYDAKAAGWWVWGASNWIGSGWCAGVGPWTEVEGQFVDLRQLPHLSEGKGVNRKLPHLSEGKGVNRKLPHLSEGKGVNRKLFLLAWFETLAERLRETRVACGDWSRVVGPSVLGAGSGVTGVFLDPPYTQDGRVEVYALDNDVAADVRRWCAENGSNDGLRIVLAGYAGEHDELTGMGWRAERWKARGGYGSQGDGRGRENAGRERLWFSPHCFAQRQPSLFGDGPFADGAPMRRDGSQPRNGMNQNTSPRQTGEG